MYIYIYLFKKKKKKDEKSLPQWRREGKWRGWATRTGHKKTPFPKIVQGERDMSC